MSETAVQESERDSSDPIASPARSQISSPKVAKISGLAMRIAAVQKLAERRISKRSMAYSLTTRNRVSMIASTINSSAAFQPGPISQRHGRGRLRWLHASMLSGPKA